MSADESRSDASSKTRRALFSLLVFLALVALSVFLAQQTDDGVLPPEAHAQPVAQDEAPGVTGAAEGSIESPSPVTSALAKPSREVVGTASESAPQATSPAPVCTVRGVVVDDLGAPVPTFTIQVAEFGHGVGESPEDKFMHLSGTLDKPVERRFESASGHFTMDGIKGGQLQVVAKGEGDRRSTPVPIDASVPGDDVRCVLPRTATITGSVRETHGAPIGDAELYVIYAGQDLPDFSSRKHKRPRTRTDASGAFRIAGLLPGEVRVGARHPGLPDGPSVLVLLAPGEERDVLLEIGTGGRIEGTVDSALGDIADRRVDLMSLGETSGWSQTTTDAAGSFVFEAVIPQDYIVELQGPGYGKPPPEDVWKHEALLAEYYRKQQESVSIRKRVSVEGGETTRVEFTAATHLIAVRGRVSSGGDPIEGVEVQSQVKEGDERGAKATTGTDGSFELELGEPGLYLFDFYNGRGSSVSIERNVPNERSVELSFELPPGRIDGTVVGAHGAPAQWVPVTLLRDEDTADADSFWQRLESANTNQDGKFSFGFLEPGTYTLRAPDGSFMQTSPPVVRHGCVTITGLLVGEGVGPHDLRITLPAEGKIVGRVTDASGVPVHNASVWIMDRTGRCIRSYSDTVTDGTGMYRVLSVAPGTYTAICEKGGKSVTSAPLDVIAGDNAAPKLVLP